VAGSVILNIGLSRLSAEAPKQASARDNVAKKPGAKAEKMAPG
jgi:hypothetical protein